MGAPVLLTSEDSCSSSGLGQLSIEGRFLAQRFKVLTTVILWATGW